MLSLFKNSNFTKNWASAALAQTGSFFTMLAIPWLVLGMTNNDPWLMTSVMATWSLPHSIFVLLGGAIVDKVSPLKTLIFARSFFVLFLIILAAVTWSGELALWSLYIFALLLGSLGAIAVPASQAMLPSIVESEKLGIANAVQMGTMQLAQVFGPVLAGWLIWAIRTFNNTDPQAFDTDSIAVAFAIDALLVFAGLCFLGFMTLKPQPAATQAKESIFKMLSSGMIFCWENINLRMVLSYLIIISFFLHGPLYAILPLLTKVSLGQSEAEYGSLFAIIGVGMVIGAGLVSYFKPSPLTLGKVVLLLDLGCGIAMINVSQANSFAMAAICLAVIGICTGAVMVAGMTWFQQRTPPHLMGRVMSILMFTISGLTPLSTMLTGIWISYFSITSVGIICGCFICLTSLFGLSVRRIRNMGHSPEYCGATG
jgi:MFS family permease